MIQLGKENSIQTSKEVASKAAEQLNSKESSKEEKSVAGSALANSKSETK